MVAKGWFKPPRSGAHKFYVAGTKSINIFVGATAKDSNNL